MYYFEDLSPKKSHWCVIFRNWDFTQNLRFWVKLSVGILLIGRRWDCLWARWIPETVKVYRPPDPPHGETWVKNDLTVIFGTFSKIKDKIASGDFVEISCFKMNKILILPLRIHGGRGLGFHRPFTGRKFAPRASRSRVNCKVNPNF